MRRIVVLLLLIVGSASSAQAQQPNVLPEVIIGRGSSDGGSHANEAAAGESSIDRCVEVEIGSSKAMNCLNQKLKREVDRVNPSINQPPIDARSPDTKIGVINIPGVQQQYGRNFGQSVVPFRPPPPVFAPIVGGHR
jgi:hypothetical protein